MKQILTKCKFCHFQVISTENWLISNKLLFCGTCCKSFAPAEYSILEMDTRPRYDNDEYKNEIITKDSDFDEWTIDTNIEETDED